MTSQEENIQIATNIFRQRHQHQTITNLHVRPLRDRFTITALVNNIKTTNMIPIQEITHNNQGRNYSTSPDNNTSQIQYNPQHYAKCIACERVGQIGNLCAESQCEDSSAIYADPLVE